MIEYTLEAEDVVAARLLAIGIRTRVELAVFALVVAALLGWSVSPWAFMGLPLLTGLTACLGAFRLMQIAKVRDAALTAYRRNWTLRSPTAVSWDADGVTIQPAGAPPEHVAWCDLVRLRENPRIVLLQGPAGQLHALPKRAFSDSSALSAFRRLARARQAP